MDSALESLIREILQHPGLALSGAAEASACVEPFVAYCRLWQKWNRKIKLTSEHDPEEFFRKHVFDSLQYARLVSADQATLDIGAGGGFPGIPLKIVYPALPLVLLESQRKKTGFLHAVGAELGLKGIRVVNARAEEAALDPELAGRFDRVVFRAFGSTRDCLRIARPFLRSPGKVVVKKGVEEEGESHAPAGSGYQRVDRIPIQGHDGKTSLLLGFALVS